MTDGAKCSLDEPTCSLQFCLATDWSGFAHGPPPPLLLLLLLLLLGSSVPGVGGATSTGGGGSSTFGSLNPDEWLVYGVDFGPEKALNCFK